MTLNEFAAFIIRSPRLEDKLFTPASFPADTIRRDIFVPDSPEREIKIRFSDKKVKMPRLEHLNQLENRIHSLHHFANHELMAIELFAWAILKFQDASTSVRKSLYKTLLEEQTHLRLYIDSIRKGGMNFGDKPLNYIFWKQIPNIQTLDRFYAVMALTFEGANLDYSIIYKKAFEKFGDTERAEIMQRVHADEIKHVRRGTKVLFSDGTSEEAQWKKYLSLLEYPFTPRRAKGTAYFPELRVRAGLSDSFAQELGSYSDDYVDYTNARILKDVLGNRIEI
ncbi:hypothetical protein CH373_01330 [Leptospira perolatii]|uniref:DUF455 domain-containing protein n=1 Tax=Leptospira perolatii TaxID=2023191 RepID=A0A2M9ZRX3_9LEPT|nr:DUF455 family protein [Leptospira perolatii]PJZ71186.1 hypothetical protein CH360_01330 [Leptospira perolatii]PJZ74719.1 hypothetical protein CH373_01330 [Leptospira perolatii]